MDVDFAILLETGIKVTGYYAFVAASIIQILVQCALQIWPFFVFLLQRGNNNSHHCSQSRYYSAVLILAFCFVACMSILFCLTVLADQMDSTYIPSLSLYLPSQITSGLRLVLFPWICIQSFMDFFSFCVAAATWLKLAVIARCFSSTTKKDSYGDLEEASTSFGKAHQTPVQVIMPIYREPVDRLKETIRSLINSNYSNLSVMLSFDDDTESPEFLEIIDFISSIGESGVGSVSDSLSVSSESESQHQIIKLDCGVVHVIRNNPRGTAIEFTVARFQHSGKLGTQQKSFEYLKQQYYEKKPLLFLIDSDVIVYPDTVHEMAMHLEEKGKKRDAVTGMVHCTTSGRFNLWNYIQDVEYSQAYIMSRMTENYLGGVTCLPGVCTMIRFEALERVADEYFGSLDDRPMTSFQYCQQSLGEDRFLTYLLLKDQPEQKGRLCYWMMGKCKTEAVPTLSKLIKQRRRWILGQVTNDAAIMCNPDLWKNSPLLLFYRTLMNMRFGSLLIYAVFLEELMKLSHGQIPYALIVLLLTSILPSWIVVSLYGISERRLGLILVYPLLCLTLPLVSLLSYLDSILTIQSRSWGGSRFQ